MKWRRAFFLVRLGALAYAEVCGGPFSIELAVRAVDGPIAVLLAIPIVIVCFCIPIIYISTKLVEEAPNEDGGCVGWAYHLTNKPVALTNVYFTVAANVSDLAIYPLMMMAYMGRGALYVGLPLILGGVAFNLLGLRGLSFAQLAASGMVGVVILVWFAQSVPAVQAAVFTVAAPLADWDWGLYVSTLLWNFVGFSDAASVTDGLQVKPHDYWVAFIGAAVCVGFTYALPLVVASGADTYFSNWHVGSLLAAAKDERIHALLFAVAVFSIAVQFLTTLGMATRQMAAAGRYRILPAFVAKEWARGNERIPATALGIHAAISTVLLLVPIAWLLEVTVGFIIVTLYIQAGIAWKFKRTGAMATAVLSLGLCLSVGLALQPWAAWACIGAVFVCIFIDYSVRRFRGNLRNQPVYSSVEAQRVHPTQPQPQLRAGAGAVLEPELDTGDGEVEELPMMEFGQAARGFVAPAAAPLVPMGERKRGDVL